MGTFYKSEFLKPHELCSKEFYEKAAAVNVEYIYWQFNPLVLVTVDMLRKRFGAVTVNNWKAGGSFQNRGLRTEGSVGATFSPHKRGAALDCNFKNATPEEIRKVMADAGCFKAGFKDRTNLGENECFRHIGRVETTSNGTEITWFHFDIWNCQNTDGSIMRFGS